MVTLDPSQRLQGRLRVQGRLGAAVGENDVHRPQKQRIGQFHYIGDEFHQQRMADAQPLGQRPVSPHYFSGGLQQLRARDTQGFPAS